MVFVTYGHGELSLEMTSLIPRASTGFISAGFIDLIVNADDCPKPCAFVIDQLLVVSRYLGPLLSTIPYNEYLLKCGSDSRWPSLLFWTHPSSSEQPKMTTTHDISITGESSDRALQRAHLLAERSVDQVASHAQDDGPGLPNAEPAVPASDSRLDTLSPIKALPIELLLAIFDRCDPMVRERLKLSHTCHDWRSIAIGAGSLWTNIHIDLYNGHKEGEYEKCIALLGLQFSRARGKLLDIRWTGDVSLGFNRRLRGRYIMLLQLLRLRAPFSRWRSLVLELGETGAFKEMLLPTDMFANLERLSILEPTSASLVYAIGRTATSKLKVFHLRKELYVGGSMAGSMAGTYDNIIGRVTELSIQQPRNTPLQLPANVVDLQVGRRESHLFPHIISYQIILCIFEFQNPFDLQCLTRLTVSKALEVYRGCHVNLPSLQYLNCANIFLGDGSVLEAPNLATLRFSAFADLKVDFNTIYLRAFQLGVAISHPGYLLSPKHSVSVELPLEEATIISLLEQCSEVEHISLLFLQEGRAVRILSRIFGQFPGAGGHDGRRAGARLCPRLSELKLSFSWVISDVEFWKRRSSSAIEGIKRRRAPSIYGSWEGDGTYVLLA